MSRPEPVREPFTIYTASGDPIAGDVRYPGASVGPADGAKGAPVVVVCHSFMAFKDWGFFPVLGRRLAEEGFLSVVFNFSHNGAPGDAKRITDLEKFSHNTFRQELADLGSVLDALARGTIGGNGRADPARIALLGHSRGGGIAILRAASDERVRALVSWSAVATFDRWTEHQKARWRANGFLALARDTAASPLRLGLPLLREYEEHRQELDIVEAARRIHIPWLILHGQADLTVKPAEAQTLYEAADRRVADLVLLDAVGHLYNAASPDEDGYRVFEHVFGHTSQWLHHHLS